MSNSQSGPNWICKTSAHMFKVNKTTVDLDGTHFCNQFVNLSCVNNSVWYPVLQLNYSVWYPVLQSIQFVNLSCVNNSVWYPVLQSIHVFNLSCVNNSVWYSRFKDA